MVLSTCSVMAQEVPSHGEITGTVVDDHGVPVSDADGCALPLGIPMAAAVPCGRTDSKGKFTVGHLRWATYHVYAKKEDEAYPDKSHSFYKTGEEQKLTLSADHPKAEVRLLLGPKAGIVIGSVTNAETSDKVFDFTLELAWVSDPNRWISKGTFPDFRLLVPSNVDLVFRCEMPGSVYEPWDYKRVTGSYLKLKPGEELKLDIKFHPRKIVPETNTKAQRPKLRVNK